MRGGLSALLSDLRTLPAPVWILVTGTFINRFGSFVVVFLVLYLTRLGHSPSRAGLALAAYGLGAIAASWIGGVLADRFGRRRSLALSMFSSALAIVTLPMLSGYEAILITSAIIGLTAELYRPASNALITDLTAPEQRLTAFAINRLAINLGFAVGPALGGFLADRSFLYLFIGDAATSVVFGAVALVFLPRVAPLAASTSRGFTVVFRDRPFVIFLFASVAVGYVFFQSESTFPLYVKWLGYPSWYYGLLLSINGGLIVILEVLLTAWTRRHKAIHIIALGYFLVGAGFAVNAVATTVPLLIVGVVIWTFGEMIGTPTAAAWVGTVAPEDQRGRYMGAWGLTWGLGLVAGPALGTLLFEVSPAITWITCGVLGLIATALVLTLNETRPETRSARGDRR